MMAFFANIFGYLLNFLYNLIGNYGVSIIIFSIIIKLVMLPLSIKQQKTMKKNAKLQVKMKEIQFKYKNDPEKLNKETLNLYKTENMSPFSGCFSAIIQLILLLSIFYLVRSPLTYMKKIDNVQIEKYENILKQENLSQNSAYPEIDLIREIETLKTLDKEEINKDELDKMSLNTQFLGLDLSKIPTKNSSDWKVFIIPILYVIVSFISMKITINDTNIKNNSETKLIKEDNSKPDEKEDMVEAMNQINKNMSMTFPIMYLAVALFAPLGLALYWLVNSVLMIGERLLLNKIIKDEEN